ncbi:hypothetical protein BH11BAC2_BH11BAC2_01030 [soil metagenome]
MHIINRDLLVITPKQACVDWANALGQDFELSIEDMSGHDAASSFLIPEFEDEDEAFEWMAEAAESWFSLLLREWTDDEALWPENLSWENLNVYFHISYQSMIFDVVPEQIVKDEEGLEDEDAELN